MLATLFGILFTLAGLLCLALLVIGQLTKPRLPSKDEKYYYRSSKEKGEPVPTYSIAKEALVELSVVIPAYNEVDRLPVMLKEALQYLRDRTQKDPKFSYELIIVDDGSSDTTADCALEFAKKENCLKELCVLRLTRNRGKGGAVAQGMLISKGKNVLFADADGATQFQDVALLEKQLTETQIEGFGLVAGSRSHLVGTDAVVKRSFLRNTLMYGFHTYLYLLGIRGIQDTQCGFKLFTRPAAHRIFHNLHTEGWIFDIETLLLAQLFNIPVQEIPVNWQEIDGSKVSIIKDSIRMALDLLMVRLSYFWGVWRVTLPEQEGPTAPTSTRS